MKAALLALVLLVGGGAAIPASAPAQPVNTDRPEHLSSVRLLFKDGGSCTGTVIGPHTILSASHCFADAPLVGHCIAGICLPAAVTKSVSDGRDHTIIWVGGSFGEAVQARIGAAKLVQGEELHFWGNPLGRRDLLRRGYVSGFESPDWVLIDSLVGPGDSGSGLFNEAGEIVGVISSVYAPTEYFHLMGARMLGFTPEQYAQAQL